MALRYIEVKKYIIELIRCSKAHEKIPSRQWICMKLNVARATVDKAVSELIKDGTLYAVTGSGTFISEKEKGEKISNWAVILPNITNEVYPDLLRGIEDFAANHKINIVICNSDNNPMKQFQYIKRLIDSDIDGCVIVPSIVSTNNYEACKTLSDAKIPFVLCNRYVERIEAPLVTSNNYYGAYKGTQYLIERECKQIAYMSIDKYITSMERFYGYTSALTDAGMDIDETKILLQNDAKEGFKEKVTKILHKNPHLDGIVCFNDTVASMVYPIVTEHGYVVGKDISIIGYDNSRLADRLQPPLTSVTYQSSEIGFCAAQTLYELVEDNCVALSSIQFFKPYIKERGSCVRKGVLPYATK